jgi:hypothetical protein
MFGRQMPEGHARLPPLPLAPEEALVLPPTPAEVVEVELPPVPAVLAATLSPELDALPLVALLAPPTLE